MINEEQQKQIKTKVEERARVFNYLFNTEEGKVVYKDLRQALVINPELITNQHTSNIKEASLIQMGMRFAFNYIDEYLDYKIINKL